MEKRVWKGLNGLLTEKRVGIACCVLLGLTLLPVAALSVYNHPCSDDYSYGLYVAQAVRSGGSLWNVLPPRPKRPPRPIWTGREPFSAVFLMALQPAALGRAFTP